MEIDNQVKQSIVDDLVRLTDGLVDTHRISEVVNYTFQNLEMQTIVGLKNMGVDVKKHVIQLILNELKR